VGAERRRSASWPDADPATDAIVSARDRRQLNGAARARRRRAAAARLKESRLRCGCFDGPSAAPLRTDASWRSGAIPSSTSSACSALLRDGACNGPSAASAPGVVLSRSRRRRSVGSTCSPCPRRSGSTSTPERGRRSSAG
jgi:hypothetical protein